jgi:signal transduction histidine kinase
MCDAVNLTGGFEKDDAKSVNVILHSSSVLGLLVNNVLSRDVVRSEESVVWEDTDLRSFVAGILDLLKNLVFKSDIRFDVAVSEAVPEMVVLPRSMLTQILLNLGLNAIKHAGSGKEVLLRVEANFDNNLECQVCDRGPGLGDEEEVSPQKSRTHLSDTKKTDFWQEPEGVGDVGHWPRVGGVQVAVRVDSRQAQVQAQRQEGQRFLRRV